MTKTQRMWMQPITRSRRPLWTLVAAMAIVAAACGGGDDDPATAGDQTPAEVYSASCARCHGGSFEGAFGPALNSLDDREDSELIDAITNGRNSMPSWGSRLSEAQIVDMVEYLRGAGG